MDTTHTLQSRSQLAVLGSPIAHSLSPKLHTAAYAVLGLPWSYDAIEMDGAGLAGFLDSCDDSWRGLSMTMPLKRDVLPLLDSIDPLVEATGGANTLHFDAGARRGYNTDVAGITTSFRQNGVESLGDVLILGGGATAASALVAVAELGTTTVRLVVRNPERARGLERVASEIGVRLRTHSFADAASGLGHPDAVISTVPNGTELNLPLNDSLKRGSVLFDVAYDPWPSGLAASWLRAGGQVISGLAMLVNQAVVQVRIFASGDPRQPLPGEASVLEAMWASVEPDGPGHSATT